MEQALKLKDDADALQQFKVVQTLRPRDTVPRQLAQLYSHMGQLPDAISE